MKRWFTKKKQKQKLQTQKHPNKEKPCPTTVCLKLASEKNFPRNRQHLKLPSVNMMGRNEHERSLKNPWFSCLLPTAFHEGLVSSLTCRALQNKSSKWTSLGLLHPSQTSSCPLHIYKVTILNFSSFSSFLFIILRPVWLISSLQSFSQLTQNLKILIETLCDRLLALPWGYRDEPNRHNSCSH